MPRKKRRSFETIAQMRRSERSRQRNLALAKLTERQQEALFKKWSLKKKSRKSVRERVAAAMKRRQQRQASVKTYKRKPRKPKSDVEQFDPIMNSGTLQTSINAIFNSFIDDTTCSKKNGSMTDTRDILHSEDVVTDDTQVTNNDERLFCEDKNLTEGGCERKRDSNLSVTHEAGSSFCYEVKNASQINGGKEEDDLIDGTHTCNTEQSLPDIVEMASQTDHDGDGIVIKSKQMNKKFFVANDTNCLVLDRTERLKKIHGRVGKSGQGNEIYDTDDSDCILVDDSDSDSLGFKDDPDDPDWSVSEEDVSDEEQCILVGEDSNDSDEDCIVIGT